MKNQRIIELLAPAANFEVAVAAIQAGADAIYIGANRFSARSAAGNSIEEIAQLCRYAKPFGVKIYLALNTLLRSEDELRDAESLAREAIDVGIDGIIFQDVRLLDMGLPIEMHASTQTAQFTVERALEFQRAGVTRVVLERGLSIDEVREISSSVDVELEVFVHGAICVGYSGICYLSEHLAGRSGNRGECAQPCRGRYNLIDGRGNIVIRDEALLSPRDLNLSARLGELIDAGVTSLKIEGRLKDKDYVANVVAHYNKILRGMGVQRQSWGRSEALFTPDVRMSFNRGFTEWFFDGTYSGEREVKRLAQSAEVAGEYIGEVRKVARDFVEVELESDIVISNGDGLSYRDEELRVQGVRVNRAEGARLYMLSTEGLSVGLRLYRNSRVGWVPRSLRAISTTIKFSECEDFYRVEAVGELGVTSHITISKDSVEVAQNSERAAESLRSGLSKSGGTIFKIESVEINCASVPFMRASEVNALRRKLLQLLEDNYTALSLQRNIKGNRTSSRGVDNPHPEALMTTRYCILREKGLCLKESHLPQPLYLLNNHVKVFLRFDCKACMMELFRD